jgi:hypothetical protein
MILKEVKNVVKNVDFFGESIHLRINNQTTSKTLLGGISSIFIIVGFSSMFITLSLDIFQKEKPIVSLENRILSKSPNLTLDSFSLPISINLQDYYLNTYYMPNIFVLEAYLVSRINDSLIPTKLDLENCSLNNFPQISNKSFIESKLYNNLCIKNQSLSIGGNIQEDYVQYITIGLKTCINSTNSNITCASENEIMDFFSKNTLYFSLYFQNNIINSQNYLYPETSFIKNVYKMIKYGLYKESGLFFKNQILFSDNGFILDTNYQHNVVSYNQEYYEFSDMNLSDGYLCSFFLYSSNLMEIYRRNYTKFQDVLANVGALSNMFIYILQYFVSIFSSNVLNQHILNKIFDFLIIKKQISKNETINFGKSGLLNIKKINNLIYNAHNNLPEEIKSENVDMNSKNNKNENGDKLENIKENRIDQIDTQKNKFSTPRIKINEENIPDSIDILKVIESHQKNYRLKFTSTEILLMNFLPCFKKKELKEKFLLYEKSLESLNDYLDISYIITKLEELEKLKLLLLSYDQLAVFNFISKDFFTLDELTHHENKIGKYRQFQKDNKQLANTIAKFKVRIQESDNLSEIDKKIYDLLREDLKY